jgi:cell division transport system ATP-binding protein
LYDRSVFDNIALPLRIAGMGQSETRRRVQAALDKVGLTGRDTTFPLMLSAGEKQRVGIARAMVNKPTIILADEPTGNLDPELAQDIMFTFAQFNELGATVMIASHDHALVERMKKRTIVLQKVD